MASPGSVGIGKIFGIDIELHWSFIFMIVLFLLLAPYFGLVVTLLFVCVLVHELAHSVTAKRNGIKVKSILLMPLMGLSVMDTRNIAPRVEFNVALVGPLMSLFLGGIFGILSAVTAPGLLHLLIQDLFVLNILIGGLNILPAFPMDGGRIFRSYLQRKRNLYDSTRITASVTNAILWLIMIATLYIVIFGSGTLLYKELVFLIDLIVVFFIYSGMKSELMVVTLKTNTEGMKVMDAANRHFAQVRPGATLAEVEEVVAKTGYHIVLMRTSEGYSILNLAGLEKSNALIDTRGAESIAVPLQKLKAGDTVSSAIDLLANSGASIAAVERNGKLAGVITMAQLQAFSSLRMLRKRQKRGQKGF